jgi:hypothetical protein
MLEADFRLVSDDSEKPFELEKRLVPNQENVEVTAGKCSLGGTLCQGVQKSRQGVGIALRLLNLTGPRKVNTTLISLLHCSPVKHGVLDRDIPLADPFAKYTNIFCFC